MISSGHEKIQFEFFPNEYQQFIYIFLSLDTTGNISTPKFDFFQYLKIFMIVNADGYFTMIILQITYLNQLYIHGKWP